MIVFLCLWKEYTLRYSLDTNWIFIRFCFRLIDTWTIVLYIYRKCRNDKFEMLLFYWFFIFWFRNILLMMTTRDSREIVLNKRDAHAICSSLQMASLRINHKFMAWAASLFADSERRASSSKKRNSCQEGF